MEMESYKASWEWFVLGLLWTHFHHGEARRNVMFLLQWQFLPGCICARLSCPTSHERPWVALSPGRILNPLFQLHFSSCPSGTVTWEGVLCWVPCVLLAESLREPDP